MSASLTVAAVLLVLFAIGLSALGFVYFQRFRRARRTAEKGARVRDLGEGGYSPVSPWSLDARHPATRITPFGTRDASRPGENMRIARRRDDGVWEFFDVDPATTPPPRVYDPSAPPSPASIGLNHDPFAARHSLAPSHVTQSTYLTAGNSDSQPPTPTSTTSSAFGAAMAKEKEWGSRLQPGYPTMRAFEFDEVPPPPAYTRRSSRVEAPEVPPHLP